MYPNPTKDAVNIELDTRYEEVRVLIKNVLGQMVLQKSYRNVNGFQLTIPGEAGIYFMEVNYNHSKVVKNVLKE
ncbi:MAG: T9SS type A sorting domain-containing protein [Bacteroidetes bacterium]|nr:T9SS type A sorting domain-containing protein [Bacteroidota bacterium]